MATGYIIADDGTGNVQNMLVSDYLLLFPGANVRTCTSNFDFQWNNVTIEFVAGINYVLTPDLWTALQAAGLPIS
jgi:hypothetical protein